MQLKKSLILGIGIFAILLLYGCIGDGKTASLLTPSAPSKPEPSCTFPQWFDSSIKVGGSVDFYMLTKDFMEFPRLMTSGSCGKNVNLRYQCKSWREAENRCEITCGPFNEAGVYYLENVAISDGVKEAKCEGSAKIIVKEAPTSKCVPHSVNYSNEECECSGKLGNTLCQTGDYCEQGECIKLECPRSVSAKKATCGNNVLEIGEQCDGSNNSCPQGRKCADNCNCEFVDFPEDCPEREENKTGKICTARGKLGTTICGPGQTALEGTCLRLVCKT